jgi:competence protein ComEA
MRVVGSRFAKPVARVALAAAGLFSLAIVGRAAVAGPGGAPAGAGSPLVASLVAPLVAPAVAPATAPSARDVAPAPPPAVDTPASPSVTVSSAAAASAHPARAAPDDPVILNAAADTDLRRLPGIGAKRADAIIALRARLGRFHAVEDLLKVRGIGRATLKRLRPLIRLDPPPVDGGLPRSATPAAP